MIQVCERQISGGRCYERQRGPGQEIETDMARREGLKIFRILQDTRGLGPGLGLMVNQEALTQRMWKEFVLL